MRRLLIRNPDLSGVEKTNLTADYTSGTTLSVINTFAFSANSVAVVGGIGEEKAEVKAISTIASDTALTLASALKFSHTKDTVVYQSPWDFVLVEGNSGAGFTQISQSGLQFDKQYTVYEHSGGTSVWDYRWRFYNSVMGTYSEYSPTFSGAGFEPGQVGYMIQNVRKITDTDGGVEVIKDYEITRSLDAAQDIVYATRGDWWFLKFEASPITTIANTFRYDLASLGNDLGFIDRIRYHLVDGGEDITYNIQFMPEPEFDDLIRDNNRRGNDRVSSYTIRPGDTSSPNGYIECYPTPISNSGIFLISAFKRPAKLEEATDYSVLPIPGILENYAISFIERVRGNDTKAQYYESLFYGPSPKGEVSQNLTGIALLQQLQDRSKPSGQPRQMWKFRGQKAVNRLFHNRYYNTDYLKETYF